MSMPFFVTWVPLRQVCGLEFLEIRVNFHADVIGMHVDAERCPEIQDLKRKCQKGHTYISLLSTSALFNTDLLCPILNIEY